MLCMLGRVPGFCQPDPSARRRFSLCRDEKEDVAAAAVAVVTATAAAVVDVAAAEGAAVAVVAVLAAAEGAAVAVVAVLAAVEGAAVAVVVVLAAVEGDAALDGPETNNDPASAPRDHRCASSWMPAAIRPTTDSSTPRSRKPRTSRKTFSAVGL